MQKWIELAKKLYYKYESMILYVFFGGLTTLINFAVHFSARFLGADVPAATTVAWFCAVLFAYFTNRKWVFKSRTTGFGAFIKEMASFFGARIFSYLVEVAIMTAFVKWLGFNELLIKIAANVVVLILNYILSKWIVFRKKEPAEK